MDVLERFKVQMLYCKIWIQKISEDGSIYYKAQYHIKKEVALEVKGHVLKDVKRVMKETLRKYIEFRVPGKAPSENLTKQGLDHSDEPQPNTPGS